LYAIIAKDIRSTHGYHRGNLQNPCDLRVRQVTPRDFKHTTDRHYNCGEEGHRTTV